VDQGLAQAQFNYGVLLSHGDGILMNNSLAAPYFKLSPDQRNTNAQLNHGLLLHPGDGIEMNKSRSCRAAGPFRMPCDALIESPERTIWKSRKDLVIRFGCCRFHVISTSRPYVGH
jgi:TPR repeat protein